MRDVQGISKEVDEGINNKYSPPEFIQTSYIFLGKIGKFIFCENILEKKKLNVELKMTPSIFHTGCHIACS